MVEGTENQKMGKIKKTRRGRETKTRQQEIKKDRVWKSAQRKTRRDRQEERREV